MPSPARVAGTGAALAAVLAFAVLLWVAIRGGTPAVDVPWAPTWELRLSFELDGIGLLYGLLATGIGALVLAYSTAYLPRHLEHHGHPPVTATSFYGWLLLFLVSMVGLATAQDLVLIFVFWDLTAVSSYFLIAFDRHEADARRAALMAMLVTAVTAVPLLIAAVLLRAEYGTVQLPELAERVEPGATLTVAGALILVAALAKSAQVPFHFWLPRAMIAPTPVSAYLHSAAMVAAGVLLIGRAYPLIEPTGALLDVLVGVGFASIAVGGVLALTRDELKPVLAYSTISQYGYVTLLYGIGGETGAAAAPFYVIAHALAKCALFLTAGAVSEATGRHRLSELGGLARGMPVVAAGSAAAAATLVALPLTIGFFKDELLFKAAIEAGTGMALGAAAAAALTFAYVGRFWLGVFAGPQRARPEGVPARLVGPVAILGGVAVAGGLAVVPFASLAARAGEASLGAAVAIDPAYHADLRAENVMAAAAWAAGGLVLLAGRVRDAACNAVAAAGARFGPERWYRDGLRGLNALSDSLHDIEVRDLRTRIAAVLVPGGALVLLGALSTPTAGAYDVGAIAAGDVELLLALVVSGLAALALTVPRAHLTVAMLLSAFGFSLAVVYALIGAPDVALVAVLVEITLGLLLVVVLRRIPAEVLRREASLTTRGRRRWRDPLVAAIAGGAAFVVVWSALSGASDERGVAGELLERTPDAHADDAVTAILADFRGLDTLGEVSVVAVAMIGVLALLRPTRERA